MTRLECLPVEEWPAQDRAAWARACQPRQGLWGDGGAALRLRPVTLRNYQRAYGVWLAHLRDVDDLDPTEGPATRITPARAERWVRAMMAIERELGTLHFYVINLHSILKLMAPGIDTKFLLQPGGRSLARAFPQRAKPFAPEDSLALLRQVDALHARGLAAATQHARATDLRDAAFMGLMLAYMPRIGDASSMRIGVHLIAQPDGLWLVRFPEETTKGKRTIEYVLDARRSTLMTDYITLARPHFRGAGATDLLWMGHHGRALNHVGASGIFQRRTLEWLGQAHGPHMARKWLTSTAARISPEAAADAALTAGHSLAVSRKHYAEATSLHAGIRHAKHLKQLRRAAEGTMERVWGAG